MIGACEILTVVLTLTKAVAVSDVPLAILDGDGSISFSKKPLMRSSSLSKAASQEATVPDEIRKNINNTMSTAESLKNQKVALNGAVQEQVPNTVAKQVAASTEVRSLQDSLKIQEELDAARVKIATFHEAVQQWQRKAMEFGKGSPTLASAENKQNAPSEQLLSLRQTSLAGNGDMRSGWLCPWNCAEFEREYHRRGQQIGELTSLVNSLTIDLGNWVKIVDERDSEIKILRLDWGFSDYYRRVEIDKLKAKVDECC